MPRSSHRNLHDDVRSPARDGAAFRPSGLKEVTRRVAADARAGPTGSTDAGGATASDLTPLEPLAVSISEAARLLGIGRTHLYAQLQQNTLVARKIGKRTVITLASIKALLDAS